jgi:hypothetical protein
MVLLFNMNKTQQILQNATEDYLRNLRKGREIQDPDICPECESMTHSEVETREGGYNEIVRYCYGCGATQTA